MPRPKKPARLYPRPDTGEWIIRGAGPDKRTGFHGDGERAQAEAALARHLTERGEAPVPVEPEEIPVNVLVADYCAARADHVADPDRLDYAAEALAPFWTGKTVAHVTDENCQAYTKHREAQGRSRSTARKELGTLRAALNHNKKRLTKVPDVWLPEETDPRPDWLTRDEFAAMLWQLWRQKRSRHAARMALCQFYTGSRPRTVGKTTRHKRKDGPWIDLEQEIWWRRGDDEKKSRKAREPHRIARRLLAHLRRWQRIFPEWVYVIEHPRHPGKPVLDIEKALTTACEKAGVQRITPHGLKHTAITLFIQGGGSKEKAEEYYSTSAATITKTYWHHSPLFQKEAAQMADRLGRTETHKNPRKSVQTNESGR